MEMEKDLFGIRPVQPELTERPLITGNQALALEKTFKMLANATRLRMVHALARNGELCVSELAGALNMKPTAVSNQLQRLSDRGVVTSRREGLQIFYRILDPCAISVLSYAWCLTECAESRITEKNINERTDR